jgi:hypothetical protein
VAEGTLRIFEQATADRDRILKALCVRNLIASAVVDYLARDVGGERIAWLSETLVFADRT